MRIVWTLVVVASCGKGASDESSSAPSTKPGSAEKPTVAPSPETPRVDMSLPDAGMLCFSNRKTGSHVWKADGTFAPYPESRFTTIAPDGAIWQIQRDTTATWLVSRTNPATPPIKLPDHTSAAWISASGSVLAISFGSKLQIWRDNKWTPTAAPPGASSVPRLAVEHQGKWWVLGTQKFFRETTNELVPVDLGQGVFYPTGIVQQGDSLSLFFGSDPGGTKRPLLMANVNGDTVEKPKQIGELISGVSDAAVVRNPAGSWAVFSRGGVYGTIFSSIGKGATKIENPTRLATGLLAIDGHDRLWYQTADGFVVRSPDGTERAYPNTTHAMFQLDAPTCAPLGKGFETLPVVTKSQLGTLVVEVSGAPRVEIAVCPKLLGTERCENSPKKYTGTLDEDGHWDAVLPIGTYEATVQINGKWLVARPEWKARNWYCEVQPKQTCTIKLRTR